ncbi:SGNH/GDSL hydrolase family protein [Longitalea luteola]|uniref:SGNH/GDSL hydrolase family protein n=1 Tax=Longitalea luteola TaxID=2812563 RepID=UPI001A96184D|nr:SGNH/GDSL hydrolase family protein [Longitalea luteola]
MKKHYITKAALVIALAVCSTTQAQITPFKKGDRIVFAGNSITDGGHYHSYIWLYYMTRFPNRRIDIFNAGIGGDVAGQIYDRFDGDVAAKKPTVIALTFGMNDTKYGEYLQPDADEVARKAIAQSHASYLKIEQKLKALPAVRKILMSSSPYDETVKGRGNYFPKKSLAMLQVAKFQEEAANKNQWGFVDFNRPMTAINQQWQQNDSTFTICGSDRVHPGLDGHMIMAYIFLKAQGFANKEVATVVVDAANKKLQKASNCAVTNLTATANSVQFDYLANALPYPLDTVPRGWNNTTRQSDAVRYIPFMEEMNRELFTVKGLKPAKNYVLQIDGETIGSFSGAQWSEGINLAAQNRTPQYQQASAVLLLNEERWELERRFRMHAWMEYNILKEHGLLHKDDLNSMDTIRVLAEKNGWIKGNMDNYTRSRVPAIRQAWQKEMEVLISTIYTINKPVNRHCIIKQLD